VSRHDHQRARRVAGSAAFVDTASGLASLANRLSSQPAVALDTESNSLYAYQEQVCLLQISIPGEDFIVDPLAGFDVSPLAPVLADPSVLKVLHAAEYDVMCLKRDFGFRFGSLFDTMWAARILGWSRVGLGHILQDVFDVQTSKRYQRYDWGRRPLEPEALAYARMDTHYLLALREVQMEELSRKGRLEEAQEVFEQIAATGPASNDFDPEGFWGIKGAYDMSRREAAVLRELYLWRDEEAERVDRPHFKVVSDKTLSALARARPASREQLGRVEALPARSARRYGRSLLEAIRRGERAKKPHPPSKPRPPDAVVERFEALRRWRRKAARGRGVEVDVVLANAVLWELAKANPGAVGELKRIKGLGDWKRAAYGEGIVHALRSHRARRHAS
jgi:ribonuclease D